jgi:hypothetical protein
MCHEASEQMSDVTVRNRPEADISLFSSVQEILAEPFPGPVYWWVTHAGFS